MRGKVNDEKQSLALKMVILGNAKNLEYSNKSK